MVSWFKVSGAAFGVLLMTLVTSEAAPMKLDRKVFAAKVCDAVDKAATANGIDRVFFARLLWKESLFDPNAVSPVGAEGIAQFMPGTAERRRLADPFDPILAIGASAHFLSDLIKQFGNMGLAAGAYNAGEGRIDDWLAGKGGIPAETQDYVAFITGRAIEDWKQPSAAHAIPPLGNAGDFNSQCVALAARDVTLRASGGLSRGKASPWGALLAADFNEGRAMKMFQRLKLRFPTALQGAQPFVIRKKNLSRGRRLMAFVMVGAKTRDAAQALCTKYTAAGLPCLVRKGR